MAHKYHDNTHVALDSEYGYVTDTEAAALSSLPLQYIGLLLL